MLNRLPTLAQTAPPEDDIYDIVVLAPKEPVWGQYLWLIGFLVFASIIVGLLIYFLRRRPQDHGTRTPDEIVTHRLKATQKQRESLTPNEYTLALSDALKDYLAAKFDDPVRFETTQEFLKRISTETNRFPAAAQEQLKLFLTQSDEAKYGNAGDIDKKVAPLGKIAEQVVQLCRVVNEPIQPAQSTELSSTPPPLPKSGPSA